MHHINALFIFIIVPGNLCQHLQLSPGSQVVQDSPAGEDRHLGQPQPLSCQPQLRLKLDQMQCQQELHPGGGQPHSHGPGDHRELLSTFQVPSTAYYCIPVTLTTLSKDLPRKNSLCYVFGLMRICSQRVFQEKSH